MRKLFSISLLTLLIVACQSNRQGQLSKDSGDSLKNVSVEITQAGGPAIKFDTIYFDLGSLAIDAPNQTRDFIFANTGDAPLVIERWKLLVPVLRSTIPRTPLLLARSRKSQ
jgi:hypothetical protein